MNKRPENAFLMDEFAALFNISRQTLAEYKKNNIFVPEIVDENGHRFYSTAQYFKFEIFLLLRDFNISPQDIAACTKNYDIDVMYELLQEKSLECNRKIIALEEQQQLLQSKIAPLELARRVRDNKISIEECAAEYLVTDPFPDGGFSAVASILTPNVTKRRSGGCILSYNSLQKKDYTTFSRIYTRMTQPDEYDDVTIKPEGLYATMYFSDAFDIGYNNAIIELMAFIRARHLSVVGNAYITFLYNNWPVDKNDAYVTKIAIQIE